MTMLTTKYQILTRWLIPLMIAVIIFGIVRPAFAQLIENRINLTQYLTANNVEIGDEIGENGYRQIYYVWEGGKNFITNTYYSNGVPDTESEYITWMGQSTGGAWQIFLYHIPTGATTQLSASSNNANPKISKGKVVWEGWVDNGWQVFLFDTVKVTQLTEGDLSMNPDIDGDFVTYGRRDITGTWRSVVYSISIKETKDITTGLGAKKPKVRGNKIILAGTGLEEEFPLTVSDLFLLNLPGLTSTSIPSPDVPGTVTEEEIIQELETTPSGVPVPAPEASPSGQTQ